MLLSSRESWNANGGDKYFYGAWLIFHLVSNFQQTGQPFILP
jgi:hypothetical protein